MRLEILCRKKYYRIAISAVCVAGAVVVWVLGRLDLNILPINTIEMHGEFRLSQRKNVREVMLPHVNKGFLGVSLQNVCRELREIPAIDKVEITRVWPDKIILRLYEPKIIARLADARPVTIDGKVLDIITKDVTMASLPEFEGPIFKLSAIITQYINLTENVRELSLSLSKLSVDLEDNWCVTLDNGLKIILEDADLETQIMRFIAVYKQELYKYVHKIAYADLRYTQGMAIGWKVQPRDVPVMGEAI